MLDNIMIIVYSPLEPLELGPGETVRYLETRLPLGIDMSSLYHIPIQRNLPVRDLAVIISLKHHIVVELVP